MSCGAPTCSISRGRCESCERRARYGRLAVAIGTVWDVELEAYAGNLTAVVFLEDARAFYLSALDALAEIMADRHRLIRQHRRELNDEIREPQRGQRDAYSEGLHDSHRSDR